MTSPSRSQWSQWSQYFPDISFWSRWIKQFPAGIEMMALPVMAASWQPTSAFPRNKTKRLEAKCSRAQGIGIEHDETDFHKKKCQLVNLEFDIWSIPPTWPMIQRLDSAKWSSQDFTRIASCSSMQHFQLTFSLDLQRPAFLSALLGEIPVWEGGDRHQHTDGPWCGGPTAMDGAFHSAVETKQLEGKMTEHAEQEVPVNRRDYIVLYI